MELVLLGLWFLGALFVGFLAFIALIVAVCTKEKTRFHAVNVALVLGSIALLLFNCTILLPLPTEIKLKLGAPKEERLKQVASNLEVRDALLDQQKKNPALSSFSELSYPLVNPRITTNAAKNELSRLVVDYPHDDKLRTAYAILLESLGDNVSLAKRSLSKDSEFEAKVYPVFANSSDFSPLSYKAFESVVLDKLPLGWFQQQGKLYLDRLSGSQEYSKQVTKERAEYSEHLTPRLWFYVLVSTAFALLGLAVLISILVKPAFLFSPPCEENKVLSGRMVLSVILICGYVILFLSFVVPLAKMFVPPLAASVITLSASFSMAIVACFLAVKYLIARPAKVKQIDLFKLRISSGQIPEILLYALAGVALGSLFSAVSFIAHYNLVGEISSINPVYWQMEALARGDSLAILAVNIVCIAILAPVFEEMIFRGLFYGWLRSRLAVLPAIIISALFFALYHMDLQMMPYLTGLGIALAASYERSKTLFVPILLHVIWNSWSVFCVQLVH